MPLTLAHPIAVAPLWYVARKRLDLPALITGAMIPDIMYFLYLRPVLNMGHTVPGIIIQGIPASLLLLWVFFTLMRAPLAALFPRSLAPLLPPTYTFFPAQRFAVIVLSIALGAATHVFWDSFTHDGRMMVTLLPILETQIGPLPVYKYLQYGSGIFGTVAVVIWGATALRNQPQAPHDHLPKQTRTLALLIILGVTAVVIAIALAKKAPLTPHTMLVQGTIGLIAGVWLGLLAYALWVRLQATPKNS